MRVRDQQQGRTLLNGPSYFPTLLDEADLLRLMEPRSDCGVRAEARFNVETTADSRYNDLGSHSSVEAA
jgi:hypothetical protein